MIVQRNENVKMLVPNSFIQLCLSSKDSINLLLVQQTLK